MPHRARGRRPKAKSIFSRKEEQRKKEKKSNKRPRKKKGNKNKAPCASLFFFLSFFFFSSVARWCAGRAGEGQRHDRRARGRTWYAGAHRSCRSFGERASPARPSTSVSLSLSFFVLSLRGLSTPLIPAFFASLQKKQCVPPSSFALLARCPIYAFFFASLLVRKRSGVRARTHARKCINDNNSPTALCVSRDILVSLFFVRGSLLHLCLLFFPLSFGDGDANRRQETQKRVLQKKGRKKATP